PNQAPRVMQPAPPAPVNPEYLVHQMNRLHVQPERAPVANTQKVKEAAVGVVEEIDARAPFYYLGYTFFKATAIPGHKSTWSHVERSKMNLSQADLLRLVHKQARKSPIAEQYQALSKVKRAHVDQLISELRKSDPRFEWTCVLVKEDEKPFKGKNSRRGDYETLSMNVIIMRKAADLVYPKIPVDEPIDVVDSSKPKDRVPTHVHNHPPALGPKPVPRNVPPTEPLTGPAVHQGPVLPPVNSVQQPLLPPKFHQPPPPPPPGYLTSRSPVAHGGWMPWVPGMPGMPAPMHQHRAPQHPPPGMHGAVMAGPVNAPHVETPVDKGRGVPVAPGMPHPRQEFSPRFNLPPQPESQPWSKVHTPVPTAMEPKPDPKLEAKPEIKPETLPSVTPTAEPEADLGMDASSVGDEESVFDFDDESSVTESSDDEADPDDKSQPWRGSLFRRHSSPRGKHGYRTHYRKQPQASGTDHKSGRSGYRTGSIDVVPADSKLDARAAEAGAGGPAGPAGASREVARTGRDRPKIIHAPVSADELDVEHLLDRDEGERLRGGRVRSDLRTRMLDDREARLEQRERMVEYRARMLEERERLDEACYLGRRLSLREPGVFYPRRSYFMPDGLQ
ncbi:hypothetical protein BO70DRAFT_269184, partial [Aspergillus heteromorphus CBS 117.55]